MPSYAVGYWSGRFYKLEYDLIDSGWYSTVDQFGYKYWHLFCLDNFMPNKKGESVLQFYRD